MTLVIRRQGKRTSSRRNLGLVPLIRPSGPLTTRSGSTGSGEPRSVAAEATREQGGPQISPELLAYWRSLRRVWTRDRTWAPEASKLDGRICLAGEPRAYVRSECGGDPICNWAGILVDIPCDVKAFGEVMFQGDRYVTAQSKLQELLASKPPTYTAATAADWAGWCAEVMRYVSLARWCTNMHSRYLRPLNAGPAAKEVVSQILAALPKKPQKADPADFGLADHQHILAMWAPKDFTPQAPRRVLIPTEKSDFNPAWLARGTRLRVGGGGTTSGVTKAPWPRELFRDARWPTWAKKDVVPSGTHSMEAMRIWFERSAGQGLWLDGWEVTGSVLTSMGCGGPSPYCSRTIPNLRFYWGTGEALRRLCIAWAQDIVSTSWGVQVADAFDTFLAQVEEIRPELRGISLDFVRNVRDTITSTTMNEVNAAVSSVIAGIGTGVGIVAAATAGTGPGAIVGAVVAIVGALIAGLLEILSAAGALAFGGGVLEEACLPIPVLRTIKDATTETCDFDPRGEGALDRVGGQAMAIAQFSRQNAPVNVLFEASGIGAGEEPPPNETAGPGFPEGEEDPAAVEGINPLVVLGGLGILGVIGYFALKGRD